MDALNSSHPLSTAHRGGTPNITEKHAHSRKSVRSHLTILHILYLSLTTQRPPTNLSLSRLLLLTDGLEARVLLGSSP